MDTQNKNTANELRTQHMNEVKAYSAHVEEEIARVKHELQFLHTLEETAKEFDGKVINKRFFDALIEKTGFRLNEFYWVNIMWVDFSGHKPVAFEPQVRIPVDFATGRESWQPASPNATCWQWRKGERMEAGKMRAIIEPLENDRYNEIESLRASKKEYAAFLRKARKVEAMIRELTRNGCDEMRRWAKGRDLKDLVYTSSLFIS